MTLDPNENGRLVGVPHGDDLIGIQPGDSLFYIIYPQRNVPSRKYSLIPSGHDSRDLKPYSGSGIISV
jgi:hypothetical protein